MQFGPTVHLGAFGYGNLGDELCLMEAMRAFPAAEAHAFSVAPDWTMRCVPALAGCFRDDAKMLAMKPARVVFGGGLFGTAAAFRAWMPALVRAEAAGAEIHLHNLGVAWLLGDLGWLDAAAQGVIARAASFTVRDYVSVERIAEAGIARMPRITHFPEADIEPDFSLADAVLPRGPKLLGVSIIPQPLMQACLRQDAATVRALVAEFADHAIVPIVSTVHLATPDEDDAAGCADFLREFLPDNSIVAPILLDRAHWRAELTPQRLKGIIARCDTLLTHRKHNAVHGIGAGVRVIGLHPMVDESLRRTFIALTHRLAPGSRCVGLHAPPA
ncbi:polysaccharide pyruvyl transferase family protein [Falsiroseomonas sp.]|uniref:polysaccharide pyruvyl transferase family protein n=1 Tax=Falsiroseomonas sp. TaxID=2870721 RepID=UPI0034A48687